MSIIVFVWLQLILNIASNGNIIAKCGTTVTVESTDMITSIIK